MSTKSRPGEHATDEVRGVAASAESRAERDLRQVARHVDPRRRCPIMIGDLPGHDRRSRSATRPSGTCGSALGVGPRRDRCASCSVRSPARPSTRTSSTTSTATPTTPEVPTRTQACVHARGSRPADGHLGALVAVDRMAPSRRRTAARPRRAAPARSRRAARRPGRRAGTRWTVAAPPPSRMSSPAGRGERLVECRLDAVGDEVEGRAALHLDRVVRVVREHEHRVVVRRVRRPTSRASLRPRPAPTRPRTGPNMLRPMTWRRCPSKPTAVKSSSTPSLAAVARRSSAAACGSRTSTRAGAHRRRRAGCRGSGRGRRRSRRATWSWRGRGAADIGASS